MIFLELFLFQDIFYKLCILKEEVKNNYLKGDFIFVKICFWNVKIFNLVITNLSKANFLEFLVF